MNNVAIASPISELQAQSAKALELSIGPDAIWLVQVDQGAGDIYKGQINWSSYQLPANKKLLAQRLLLSLWTQNIDRITTVISSTQYRLANTLFRTFLVIEELFPDTLASSLTKQNWKDIWLTMLFRKWRYAHSLNSPKELIATNKPLARQQFERTTSIMNNWFSLYHSGEVSDGPEYLLGAKDLNPILKSNFNQHSIDFEEWGKGGSYGTIPFVITHLLLADALETVRSTKAKMMISYFNLARGCERIEIIEHFWSASSNSSIGKYRLDNDLDKLKTSKLNTNIKLTKDCIISFIQPLHENLHLIIKNTTDTKKPEKIFPWPNSKAFRNDYNQIQAAIAIILLAVMGKRGMSEIRTLRGIDISLSDKTKGKDSTVNPSIWKTHKGMRIEHGITNFVDEVFYVALQLCYLGKKDTKLPIFSALSMLKNLHAIPNVISVDRFSHRLNIYYDDFCKRLSEHVDFDIKDMHESISTHQFRHAFAEFALRKFDGNVEELIRQHFCHSYNHWWTKRYTGDKLDAEQTEEINRRYIRELVPQILLDNAKDPEYVGAVALFLKKEFSDAINTVTAEEAEKIIENACDDIIKVTPHEYGWCLLHKDAYNSAKCRDANGIPNPQSTSAQKCTECASFCASHKSHKSKNLQIILGHLDFLEQKVWKQPALTEKSKQAVRQAQALFPEFKRYGEV